MKRAFLGLRVFVAFSLLAPSLFPVFPVFAQPVPSYPQQAPIATDTDTPAPPAASDTPTPNSTGQAAEPLPTPSATPAPTATPTLLPSDTSLPSTSTPTQAPTNISTPTATLIPTLTPAPSDSATATLSPAPTGSPTSTDTPLPTDTETITTTETETGTITATATLTQTPTPAGVMLALQSDQAQVGRDGLLPVNWTVSGLAPDSGPVPPYQLKFTLPQGFAFSPRFFAMQQDMGLAGAKFDPQLDTLTIPFKMSSGSVEFLVDNSADGPYDIHADLISTSDATQAAASAGI